MDRRVVAGLATVLYVLLAFAVARLLWGAVSEALWWILILVWGAVSVVAIARIARHLIRE